jgi:hypothetical protein
VNDTQGNEGANAFSSRQSEGIAWTTLGAASREEADAFLEEQRKLTREQAALTRLQANELEHELKLRHWSLRVHHVSDVLKLGFELAVAFILLALASAVAAEIWTATHADGLVIEAFSVPPDLAEKGLTGEVVAAKVLDRLSQLQAETGSSRAATSYANNWGSDIKVQIPNTDPLEMWGEALIKKDRADLALAKFAEANQYVPRWGRLHLKWGEALIYVGRPGDAARQFTMATGLELTAAERSELARTGAVHG